MAAMLQIIGGMIFFGASGGLFYASIVSFSGGASLAMFFFGLTAMIGGLKLILLGLKDAITSDIVARLDEIKKATVK